MNLCQKILEKFKNSKYQNSLHALREERGAIFVLTALMLPLLLGCLGFAYDAGNLYIHKARLQNTADAAVLAGGGAYVEALKEHASNGVVTSITDEQRETAKETLKSSAEQYIRNNNHIFATTEGKEEKFWFGKKTASGGENTTNNTEYFRVNLTEPVQLYFLPVFGIRNSIDVSVYATTMLTETKVPGGGNNQQNDAENRPVVIAGGTFSDEINTNDPYNKYNHYDVSTIYVTSGAYVNAVKHNGKSVVPSSEGDIIINGERYAEVVETDYDMTAFGLAIKERFIRKYIATLPAEQQAEKNAALTTFLNATKTWNANKTEWSKKYNQEYNRRYNLYVEALGFKKAQAIYALIQKYRKIVDEALSGPNASNYNYDRSNAYNALVKEQWEGEIKALTGLETDFSDCIAGYNVPGEPANVADWTGWQWQQYARFGFTQPPALSEYVSDEIMANYMAQFGALAAEPKPETYGLEYYMTYRGEEKQTLSSSDVSSYPQNYHFTEDSVKNEHSYLYLSYSNITTTGAAHNLTVKIDGFYVGGSITEDTPYYLFIESDLNLVNLEVTNCNRPLVLFYNGSYPIHYSFNSNTKGIFYSPYAKNDTHINSADNNRFSGSIISDFVEIKSHYNYFKYDPEDIKKWQEGDDGLPATPNIGFTGSNSGTGSGQQSTTKLIDRLRLYLAGDSNQNNYYNSSEISWSEI